MESDFARRRALSLVFALLTVFGLSASAQETKMKATYGLIGQMLVAPENRDALVSILVEGTRDMPGCLSYQVAKDASRPDAIWVTEVWTDKDSHANSLKLPAVQAAIAKGRPLITGMGIRAETIPQPE